MQAANTVSASAAGQKNIGITSRGAITYLSPRVALVDTASLKALQEALDGCIAESKVQLILDFTLVGALNSKALT